MNGKCCSMRQVNVTVSGLDEVNLTPLQWCFEASPVIPEQFGFAIAKCGPALFYCLALLCRPALTAMG